MHTIPISRPTVPAAIAPLAAELFSKVSFAACDHGAADSSTWHLCAEQPRRCVSRVLARGAVHVDGAFARRLRHLVSSDSIRVNRSPTRGGVILDAPVVILRAVPLTPLQIHANTLITFVSLDRQSLAPGCAIGRITLIGCGGNHPLLGEIPVWHAPAPRKAPPNPACVCACGPGFSIWHLAAAEIVSEELMSNLVAESLPVASDQIAFDLRESCTTLPQEFVTSNNSLAELVDWPREEFGELFAHRSPVEISEMLGRKFLEGYREVLSRNPLNSALLKALESAWASTPPESDVPLARGSGHHDEYSSDRPTGE